MKSMTGFGRARFKLGEVSHRVELRSLNSRHLDVRVRLPWSDAETETRGTAWLRERLARGRVELNVWEEAGASSGGLHLDETLAAQLGAAVARIAEIVGCDPNVAAALVPPVPELLSARKVSPATDELWAALQVGLDEALQRLIGMREREGVALSADMRAHLERLAQLTGQIAGCVRDDPRTIHERLMARLAQLSGAAGIDAARINQEAALLADRADVSEEIARLRSHLDQLAEMLARDEPVGRSIEFMLQEINRELNTVAAKATNGDAARYVVEAKGCVEKMREQAQNIE